MNAPVDKGITNLLLEWLPVNAICPSETPAQTRRRRRYTKESIAELAKNVAAQGLVQPVIVRKLDAMRNLATYELIAGERRWLAAQEGGLAHIPAVIRAVADEDLVAMQLTENLQRESIDALEEAEAYRDVMHDKKLKAEAVADLVGKSRRHVFNRMKLLDLKHPAARAALESGQIDSGKALRIARYPGLKVQAKAFELIGAEHVSLRQADEILRDRLMVRLDKVPFAIDDDTFRNENSRVLFDSQITHRNKDGSVVGAPPMPACISCHNCSATDHEFAGEVEEAFGKGAIVCTERPCHDFKVKVFFARKVEKARADGVPVIDGKTAPVGTVTETLKKYLELDAECQEAKGKEDADGFVTNYPTHREVLGDAAKVDAILIQPRNGEPVDLMERATAIKALKKLGIKKAGEPAWPHALSPETQAQSSDERQAERDASEKQMRREDQERAYRRKLLAEIHAKWKGPLKRDELQAACDRLMDGGDWPAYLDDLYGLGDTDERINTSRMSEKDLTRLLFELAISPCIDYLGDSPNLLLAAAKRMRIDPAKVRRQVKAEIEGGAAEPEEKAAKPKKGKRK